VTKHKPKVFPTVPAWLDTGVGNQTQPNQETSAQAKVQLCPAPSRPLLGHGPVWV